MNSNNTTLVFGLAVAGRAVAQALHDRGGTVILADDAPTEDHRNFARSINAEFVDLDGTLDVDAVLGRVDCLAPAPGVAESHSVIRRARELGLTISSELELAYNIEEQQGLQARAMIGVTGTDGKTTTTLMAAAMLQAAGRTSMAVGNTDMPLIAALATNTEVFAVECSSFRLAFCQNFRTKSSVWLNLAPDHLDWHQDMGHYEQAKAQIWAHTRAGDVAVAPVDDARIMHFAKQSTARTVTFGAHSGDYHAQHGSLNSPHGVIMKIGDMKRSMPHDVTNALAAAAVCIESGLVGPSHVADALTVFENAAHRIQLVSEIDGVRWYNDSKATSPHAAAVAIGAFENIVLIAGGKNKDLDLSGLASQPHRIKAVVAIGVDAEEIVKVFSGLCRVVRSESMVDAVGQARQLAARGDVVLLSPACTSYDWYNNYMERGQDFMDCVQSLKTTRK